MITVTQKGKKFYAQGKFSKCPGYATQEEAQMMADIMNEKDAAKAQALIDAKNAKFPK